ncbi:MAG: L-2-amino-thiazoline-4-carboxylic acid hydrolase [Synergistaceae bacterium]
MNVDENKISLLRQREIEIRVIAPLIRAFAEEFGEEKTYGTVRKVMESLALSAGKSAALANGNGLDSMKENCIKNWNSDGALAIDTIEETDRTLRFNVTRCRFAELYRELGYGDIGELVSCDRDIAFIKGFDPNIEFTRTKTIMGGADICDFCYKEKEEKC